VAREVQLLQAFEAEPEIPLPRLLASAPDGSAFVRPWVTGTLVASWLLHGEGRVPAAVLDALRDLHVAVETLRLESGITLDFSPGNICVDGRGAPHLIDGGERKDPSPFFGVHPSDLEDALRAWVPWRAALDARQAVRPMLFPPSGRLHVDVDVGHVRDARLLWVNRPLLRRRGLGLSDARLHALSTWATHAPPQRTLPATRYQDAPEKGQALGDGRALYVGETEAADGQPLELMLKGCGPTPLRWSGVEFHEDGFVSFNRTLWETSVCDELSRLGFETPEVAAIAETGKTTVDNTRIRWPAAAALRLSSSHLRVGHVVRFDDDSDAMAALLRYAGRRLVRPDFKLERPSHLEGWLRRFAARFGHNVGRSDVLQVHCFNPTLGNIRLDGNLLDFSTVRFHRWYLPDFRYMNDRRRIKEHGSALRVHVTALLSALHRGGVLDKRRADRLTARALRDFDAGFVHGFVDGLCEWLGLDDETRVPRRGARARRLVEATRALRMPRADDKVQLRFWKQSPAAPLFDLAGQLPEWLDALREGRAHSWEALRSPFVGAIDRRSADAGERFLRASLDVIGPEVLSEARPRRWSELIRPFMEPEALAHLCYERSTPDDFARWRRLLSSSARLPRGRYPVAAARARAAHLGHVAAEDRVVVGLTPQLRDGIIEAIDGVLPEGARIWLSGPRCAEDGVVVEGGADGSGASPLRVHLDRAPAASCALGVRLADLGAPFPLEVGGYRAPSPHEALCLVDE
jgi:uncharacterized protein YdiU (UPF0061 family)